MRSDPSNGGRGEGIIIEILFCYENRIGVEKKREKQNTATVREKNVLENLFDLFYC